MRKMSLKMVEVGDEDAIRLFEGVAICLVTEYHHSIGQALNLATEFYDMLHDPEFCERYNITTPTFEMLCHESSRGLADRIQYNLVMKNPFDEDAFKTWQIRIHKLG